jgi:hypothetical protein
MHLRVCWQVTMKVIAIAELALAVVAASVVLRAVVRGRRKPALPSRDVQHTPSVHAEAAESEPVTEPAQPAPPSELPPPRPPRATIPPLVAEALASEPEIEVDFAPAATDTVTPRVSAPAPAPSPETAPPPAPARVLSPVPAPAPSLAPVAASLDRATIEADDPERKKARKLARLVVSEIKLYNEKLVAEGFAAGDLYALLKEPIDQSLIVFRRRIPDAVRAEFDYMHDELVRQLAGGDATKLGPQYVRRG